MRTKYILHIGSSDYELENDDLVNWDEIRCSYKRASYEGVVRSFTSQFKFANRARTILLELYLSNRYNARASISVHTMNERWTFDKRFECPLDFSTISWDSYTLSINSVDNTLSALIKANKGTTYEFTVGQDIERDGILNFDRIPMMENITYEFTQGEQLSDSAAIVVKFERDKLPFVGLVGKEVSVNQALYWQDDQDIEPTSYLLKAEKDIDVSMEYELEWRTDIGYKVTQLGVVIRRNGVYKDTIYSADNGNGGSFVTLGVRQLNEIGIFDNPGQLPAPSTIESGERQDTYAIINGIVWVLAGRDLSAWQSTGKSKSDYFVERRIGRVPLELKAGDEVVMIHTIYGGNYEYADICIVKSKFIFSWIGIGKRVSIDLISPRKAAENILSRIAGNDIEVKVEISTHDSRLNNTWLMAAESARGIIGAKFYSSFADFCDWMSTVFGYVYYTGITQHSEDTNVPLQTVYFVHRSELLKDIAVIRRINNCRDIKYSVDTSAIYSTVTVGYDKKDYDSLNGRDEFNFNNTYSTGCSVTDKTLTLLSKYRADCYGIEFAVQKRGEDTTDTSSDKDTFFLLCTRESNGLVPDRSVTIQNSMTGAVFNGAFSPMACVNANAGYIGLQSDCMTLTFASSTGNSTIIIDGVAMIDDIQLDTPLATCGVVEFETDDVDDLASTDEVIEIRDNGIVYRGYLKEVDIKYAKIEAANYKLIVKEVLI